MCTDSLEGFEALSKLREDLSNRLLPYRRLPLALVSLAHADERGAGALQMWGRDSLGEEDVFAASELHAT